MNFRVEQEAIASGKRYRATFFKSGDPSAVVDVTGAGAFIYQHNSIDQRVPYSNPISRASLTVSLWIQDSNFDTDITQVIFDSISEKLHKVRLEIMDGLGVWQKEWEGYVIRDLCNREETEYPYRLTLVARDTTQIVGDFDTSQTEYNGTLIETIAPILGSTGLGDGVKTLTNFVNDSLPSLTDDYLSQTFFNTKQLADIGADGEVKPISKIEALTRLLKNNNLILFQRGGYWWLVNLSAVYYQQDVTEYDFDGVPQGTSSIESLTAFDVLRQSTKGNLPIPKTITFEYRHNGALFDLSFLEDFQITLPETSRTFSQYFESDGTQKVNITGQVATVTANADDDVFAYISIKAGSVYYNQSTGTWGADFSRYAIKLETGGIPNVPDEYPYSATFSLRTVNVPDPITADSLEVKFYTATDIENDIAYNSNWSALDCRIINNGEFSGNSVTYKKELSGNVSYDYPVTVVYYGDRITYTGKSGFKSNSLDYIIGGWKKRSLSMTGQSFTNLLINDIAGYYDDAKQFMQVDALEGVRIFTRFDYEGETYFVIGSTIDCVQGTSSVTAIEIGDTIFDGDNDEVGDRPDVPIGILSGALEGVETTGLVPERRIDKSEQLVANLTSGQSNLILNVSGDTTVVRVNLNQEATINFLGFKLENENYTGSQRLRDGQEILIIFNSPDIPQNIIMGGGGSGFEPILVAESSTAVRRAKNLVATFKRILVDGVYYWLKIFESAIPSEPEEPAPPIISAPVFSPRGGQYLNPQTVEIINTEDGADIFYTDDDGVPDTPYTGALNIADDTTLTAVAIKNGVSSSEVTEQYQILGYVVSAVVFSPTGGTYQTNVLVSLSTATAGANIYYTVNGSTPDSGSTLYTGAVTVSSTTTIKAIAILTVASIEYSSQVREQTYTIELNPVEPVVDPPIFSPAEGTYTESVQVEITCADSEAIIRYTTDGSEPTSASPIYQLPFLLSGQGEFTVKAITQRAGYQDGEGSAVYTLVPDGGGDAPPKPVLIPESAQFVDSKEVIIAGGATEGVQEFLYTTDGSDPTNASTLYTAPLVITETTVVKAVARFQGQTELSEVRTGIYTKSSSQGYGVGYQLISIPYRASLTAEAINTIFNKKVSAGSIFTFDGAFILVGDNLNVPDKSVRVDIGRGYWLNLSEPVSVNWADEDLLATEFNLLSNRYVYQETSGIPSSWKLVDGGINSPIVGFGVQQFGGLFYNRLYLQATTTGSVPVKFYIDDAVVKCYAEQVFKFKSKLYLPQAISGNIKMGVEVYDKNETSLYVNENTLSVTVGGYDVEEQFTIDSGANDYVLVRPYFTVTHNFPSLPSTFRLGIRERVFTTPLELYEGKIVVDILNTDPTRWVTVGANGKQFSKLRDEDGATSKIVTGSFYEYNGTYLVADIDEMESGKGYYVQFRSDNESYEVD